MLLLPFKRLHLLLKEIPRRGLERQVVLLLLRGVRGCIGNIAVRCGIGGCIGSVLFLADIEEVDGLLITF